MLHPLINFFQSSFCENVDQYYFIVIIIGLTFLIEALGALHTAAKSHYKVLLHKKPYPIEFPQITYKNLFFDFAFISAYSLIIVDLFKIVSGWDIVCGLNIDSIIKFFLCINVAISICIVSFLSSRVEERIVEPSFPPEEMIDHIISENDQRAIA